MCSAITHKAVMPIFSSNGKCSKRYFPVQLLDSDLKSENVTRVILLFIPNNLRNVHLLTTAMVFHLHDHLANVQPVGI
jgi:hypothetical protein